ncbi:uncharacterized protein F5891DRAFT_985998 [Suillus fuscotomentosus]|uniref:Uncharacterized protein n=1 Tax=Suillus fuscotomentosus TaxID=1912939 RepID=A0AAD4HF98_9AGAM|nr:uncharacterized protein F5891DRAFT_985998 [Suillus fuscotomentosus]KAG1893339.1 hypothetical protein F5891DRAFT_985998 [Suillus fuscotomentosus]
MFTRVRDDRRSEIDFIRLVLAGRIGPEADEEVDRCHITLNAQQGIPRLPPRRETTITRDIDFVIGLSRSLPYTTALSVWPVPPFKETLIKDNHLKSRAYDPEGDEIQVPMHEIPNVPLGKVEQRHVVRIFSPRLYTAASEDPSRVGLSQEDLALIYDRCLRHTMIQYLPETRYRWPTSYNIALTHARTSTGSLAFDTVDIAWRVLEQLAEIRAPLNKTLNWLPTILEDLVQLSVIAIDSILWWYLVYCGLAAIRLVLVTHFLYCRLMLVNLSRANVRTLSLDATLALSAVWIYTHNACFSPLEVLRVEDPDDADEDATLCPLYMTAVRTLLQSDESDEDEVASEGND